MTAQQTAARRRLGLADTLCELAMKDPVLFAFSEDLRTLTAPQKATGPQ
jgi:hypothetical protein